MSVDDDGLPTLGDARGNQLGVRVGAGTESDYPSSELDAAGMVRPGVGGMSVSPNSPRYLVPHRRPPEHGGTAKDPAWGIDEDALGSNLRYRPDPLRPDLHGFVEPARRMHLSEYLGAIRQTRNNWTRS